MWQKGLFPLAMIVFRLGHPTLGAFCVLAGGGVSLEFFPKQPRNTFKPANRNHQVRIRLIEGCFKGRPKGKPPPCLGGGPDMKQKSPPYVPMSLCPVWRNHVVTSGSQGTNECVIRGALKAQKPKLLTVILPQGFKKQERACAHEAVSFNQGRGVW